MGRIVLEPVSGQDEVVEESVLVARVVDHVGSDVWAVEKILASRQKSLARQIFCFNPSAIGESTIAVTHCTRNAAKATA